MQEEQISCSDILLQQLPYHSYLLHYLEKIILIHNGALTLTCETQGLLSIFALVPGYQ